MFQMTPRLEAICVDKIRRFPFVRCRRFVPLRLCNAAVRRNVSDLLLNEKLSLWDSCIHLKRSYLRFLHCKPVVRIGTSSALFIWLRSAKLSIFKLCWFKFVIINICPLKAYISKRTTCWRWPFFRPSNAVIFDTGPVAEYPSKNKQGPGHKSCRDNFLGQMYGAMLQEIADKSSLRIKVLKFQGSWFWLHRNG